MTDRGETTPEPDVEALFCTRRGRCQPGTRAAAAGSSAAQRVRAGRLAVILATVTWLPLLILAAIEGVAWGVAVACAPCEGLPPLRAVPDRRFRC